MTALTLVVGSASATQTHLLKEVFGSAEQPPFSADRGMAVEQSTERLLVIDATAGTLLRYFPNGTPANFSALGENAIDGTGAGDETPQGDLAFGERRLVQVAVDESGTATDGNIYLTQNTNDVVDIFASSGEYLGQLAESIAGEAFGEPCGVAVDENGTVYVGDRGDDMIHVYEPAASPPVNADNTASFETLADPCTLAAGSGATAGFLFVDTFGGALHKLDATTGESKYVISASGASTVTVDPATGHVYGARNTGTSSEVAKYDASGATEAVLLSSFKPGSTVEGVAVAEGSEEVYVARSSTSNVEIYGPTVTVPAVATTPATENTGTKATLNGTVDPDGVELDECFFEWGQTTEYDQLTPCTETPAEIGSGSGAAPVHADISGLVPNGTKYNFRLVAVNVNAQISGANQNFNTPSTVVTTPVSNNTGTKATLNGTVDPDGVELDECFFEWGRTSSQGGEGVTEATIPCIETPAEIGMGTDPILVHADLIGLVPQSGRYEFRLVAANEVASVNGTTQTFITPHTVVAEAASGITSTEAILNGTVNPDGEPISDCVFEWGPEKEVGESFQKYPESAPCVPAPGGITGTGPVAVEAEITGLEIGSVYHYRLRATYPTGPIITAEKTVQTAGPVIAGAWSENVVRTEAVLKADINPAGLATTYRFEWGKTTAYGNETPEVNVGSDSSNHRVSKFLEDLDIGTTYHYRVVAINGAGTNESADHTFTTYEPVTVNTDCSNQQFRTGPAANLPDCRAYEMVSPIDKNGGDIYTPNLGVLDPHYEPAHKQASVDGNKMTYSSITAFGDAVAGHWSNQYISTRNADGWSTHAVSPPRGQTLFDPGVDSFWDLQNQFFVFTPDLSSTWFKDNNLEPLTTDAINGYVNIYRRDNRNDTYEALINEGPYSPVNFQLTPSVTSQPVPRFHGFSDDLSHMVFSAAARLTPDAASGTRNQLYDLHDGELELVSVLPNGEPAPGYSYAATGSGEHRDHRQGRSENVVSNDGSRIFWTTRNNSSGNGRIYVRINGEVTIPVSASVTEGEDAFLIKAAADGSTVLFQHQGELYKFDVDTEEATAIAGSVSGVLAAEDLSHVYFASTVAYESGAVEGEPNLYLYRDGAIKHIAVLADADLSVGKGAQLFGALQSAPINRTGRVTPSGRHFVFTSFRSLTGFDNIDATTGDAVAEVFHYDADLSKLTCVSCNPSGVRPDVAEVRSAYQSPDDIVVGVRAAGIVPTWEHELYGSRVLSDDGDRVFFHSYEPLLPRDTNGVRDVYQWEASGSGDCEKPDGCIDLISTGTDAESSEFYDASVDGDEIFFITRTDIDPRDPGLIDVYVAKVNGGFPAPREVTECEGDGCYSAPPPPIDPTPASANFSGPGTPAPQPRNCGRHTQRAAKLSRMAKRVRRAAIRTRSSGRSRRLGRRSVRLAKRARQINKRAKRCRRANRRAGR